MRSNVSLRRTAGIVLIVVAVSAVSGCSWFHKPNKLYAGDAQSRPLEVPPDLDLPRTDAAVQVPGAAVTASGSPTTAPTPALGFQVTGSRDEAFNRVGDALAQVEGLTIASRAQLLGAYDVSYMGSNFLVRVSAVEGGAYVSAVDPRGTAVTGEGPTKLIGALKTALSGQ
ncbi:hypothetical protein [Agrilutibacter solisilvae]|uniref:Beta-barrel assembly machine subunit BamC n=1 Tax=Agrilutibacter solisilvae TaxID=2763317 RepID=A0A974XYL4_9GAMM|nr:hypothetical protein [Lysobacter solisilvae]QSX77330.1 hypothetical protein I8J32_011130 [Lysobacter solisilvae]